jgi:hypothetical protein
MTKGNLFFIIFRHSKLLTLLGTNQELLNERFRRESETGEDLANGNDRNIISVPNQCPQGYKPDALGYCREIF